MTEQHMEAELAAAVESEAGKPDPKIRPIQTSQPKSLEEQLRHFISLGERMRDALSRRRVELQNDFNRQASELDAYTERAMRTLMAERNIKLAKMKDEHEARMRHITNLQSQLGE